MRIFFLHSSNASANIINERLGVSKTIINVGHRSIDNLEEIKLSISIKTL